MRLGEIPIRTRMGTCFGGPDGHWDCGGGDNEKLGRPVISEGLLAGCVSTIGCHIADDELWGGHLRSKDHPLYGYGLPSR